MIKPYYQDEAVTIYLGDCREILPDLPKVDLVLTDPPYVGLSGGVQQWGHAGVAKHYGGDYERVGNPWQATLEWLVPVWNKAEWGAMIFCTYHFVDDIVALLPDAKRIALACWHKRNSPPSIRNAPHHTVEYIWYLHKSQGLKWGKLKTFFDIPKLATGCMAHERFVDQSGRAIHPTQKPEALLLELLKVGPQTVLDPFLGTGTTAVAAKKLNRKCIGIEIEERYCEIAANRCRQMVMDLTVL